jgi:hypothetical protein
MSGVWDATLSVAIHPLVANCDFFADNTALTTSPCRVKTPVPLDTVRQLLEAIEGIC